MTLYYCNDCPQMSPNVTKTDRTIEVADDVEPLFCPWCTNQTLVELEEQSAEEAANDSGFESSGYATKML